MHWNCEQGRMGRQQRSYHCSYEVRTAMTKSIPDEPDIIINGEGLTIPEAMTVRVAINSFLMELQENGALGSDRLGHELQSGYDRACRSILQKMRAKK